MAEAEPDKENLGDLIAVYEGAVGRAMTAYLLNLAPTALTAIANGELSLSPGQQTVAAVLAQLLVLRLPEQAQAVDRSEVLQALLVQTDETGVCLARRLHAQAGGVDPQFANDDALKTAVARLATDAFPAFLLPLDDSPLPMPVSMRRAVHTTSLIFRHPQRLAFEAAVRADPTLSSLFANDNPMTGPVTWAWRNSGSGGTLQLIMLADIVLSSAWRRIRHDNVSAASFAATALDELQLIRDLLARKQRKSTATFAFTGVLLPDGVQNVDLGNATLAATTDIDRERAPLALKQQLTGTDSAGTSTVVNYDGDVVLRQTFNLKVRTTEPPTDGSAPAWPQDMYLPPGLDLNAERLRLSLLLAVKRDDQVQILPTWRYLDDPFGPGASQSWSDPRQAVGLMPTKLTDDELAAWMEWYRLLSSPQIDKINVAVTRVLRAIAERREPSDVLIDAVIAWENMFGTSEGEPTMRVTASLAVLLEPTPAKRAALRTKLAKIYKLRSGVVHGSHALRNSEIPLAREALDTAIDAIRVLVRDRADVLQLADGNARSLHLLLGNPPPDTDGVPAAD